MWKRKLLAAGLLAVAVGSAQATITFSFDPTGGGAGTSGYTILDWLPGNALAVDGNPEGGLATDDVTTLLYQANLGTIQNLNFANTFLNGTGGNYFTAVAGFQEIATVNGLATSFTGTNLQSSFFNMYAMTAAGNDLTGKGFADGTGDNIILSGRLVSISSSNFTATDANGDGVPDTAVMDQFDSDGPGGVPQDNYGGLLTIIGSGSTNLTWEITFVDNNYFTDLDLIGALIKTFINSSLVDPFLQVDPSATFSSDGILDGDLAHNLGTINGLPVDEASRNFQFQADANQSLDRVAIPEPGSLLLLGIGLGALSMVRRRKHS